MESERRQFLKSVYERYRETLVAYVRTIFRGTSEEAADIVQTVFTRLAALDRPQDIQDPKTYLYRAARNAVVDSLRRHKREVRLVEPNNGEFDIPDERSPERWVLSQENLRQLEQTLVKLPAKRREVFILIRVYGKPYDTVAKQLGISLAAVQRHMARALDDCRRLFDGFPQPVRSGYRGIRKTDMPKASNTQEVPNGQGGE